MKGRTRRPEKRKASSSRSRQNGGAATAAIGPAPLDHFQESIGNRALVHRLAPDEGPLRLQRKCDKCEQESREEEEDTLRNEPSGGAEAALRQLGPGRPFEGAERSRMETAFKQDFSRVRIHSDDTAAKLSERMSAHAFTVGTHIAFARNRYRPGTLLGDALIAHELAHTLQQSKSETGISSFDVRDQEYDALENDADMSALRAMHSLWGASTGAPEDLPASAMPRLRSGLRVSLSDCFGGGGGTATTTTTSCAPVSMTKVVSGPFQGGKKMDDYYPDLVGKGYWDHGDTGGPFDTGTKAGSNVQLIGEYPSGCDKSKYTLGQTVTYDKAVFDGTHHSREGKTVDDIAKSGRDASKAPFRQEWDNKISMADPPSMDYSSTKEADFERSFETSLTGPGGAVSVKWQTAIQIRAGKVTKNTVS